MATRECAQAGPARATGPRIDPVRAKATVGEQFSSAQQPQTAQDDSADSTAVRKPTQPQHSQQLLQETHQVMVKEVQRMQATQEQLQQSSSVLEQTEATYNGQTLNIRW